MITMKKLLALLMLLVVVTSLLHLSIGGSSLSLWQLIWQPNQVNDTGWMIFTEIRLPRLMLALTNGCALGLAGAAIQLLLRNPLAEPGLLGVSGGAAVVTIAALYFGWLPAWHLGLPGLAFIGAATTISGVLLLAGKSIQPLRIILAGIAVSTFSGALMALLLYLAPNPFAFQEWSQWLLGSLSNRGWPQWYLVLPCVVIGTIILLFCQQFLQALTLSERTVSVLGFSVPKYRASVLIAVALLTAGSVVSVGIISFIGLFAPHVARLLGFQQPRQILWLSAPIAALMLVLMDCLVRTLSTARELPIGVAVALIGGPLLVVLLYRRGRVDA
ncbi:ABC transporter permease [Idiomarina tyrosinivorans]|uniref:ABC transporter permease n=1 Tax=Idiomarina tyrosinivorans TaxID=1445662 RepID=A0A432ZLC8_9GAMM|nr:iron ABC transporter permease [Idiomarina tyrosinivorans]RUO78791.1 ABC transporter permease [Idiomarina tyrosinivorans]